jgi:hypothetical protein
MKPGLYLGVSPSFLGQRPAGFENSSLCRNFAVHQADLFIVRPDKIRDKLN